MQWLQDPSQGNVANVNNVRRKLAGISGTKRRNACKRKLRSLKLKVRLKNVRDLHRNINDFRTNIVKDEKGDLVTDPPTQYFG